MNLSVYGEMDYFSVAHMVHSERKILAEILQQKADAMSGKKRQQMLKPGEISSAPAGQAPREIPR